MADWINLGEMLAIHAKRTPQKPCLSDRDRTFSYAETDARIDRLVEVFLFWGLKKGDKIAVYLENSIEIIELYLAGARSGIVIVPINFMHVAREIHYIADNADALAFFVGEEFSGVIDKVRDRLQNIPVERYVVIGANPVAGYEGYEDLLSRGRSQTGKIKVAPFDPWIILYTSGTTGRPKGVVRSHESYVAFYLINAIDFRIDRNEVCLNVMPLCHVNSTFFTLNVLYMGGSVVVQPARRFDPLALLETIERERITFISLVPTHYHLILKIDEATRKRYDTRSIRTLLCSSAPVRKEIKFEIMAFFPGVRLYEAYGSTEAGIVTTLFPEEQLEKLGSIGRESSGTALVRLQDDAGNQVPVGQVGELYSRSPMLMSGYYKMPEMTRDSFCDGYFTARDMAYRDDDGYYYLVDRKDNMIITGGEKVYPSEIEKIISAHPLVFDAAVIGLPSAKWGEEVTAIVIRKDDEVITEQELIDYCRNRIAVFKRPKKIIFIPADEMPRTATGKILHRCLRERFCPEGGSRSAPTNRK